MRVALVDGLVTLYYDGTKKLYNQELSEEWRNHRDPPRNQDDWERLNVSDECKNYWKERLSWQQVIVVHGVSSIPEYTFHHCQNIQRVIFSNTANWIGRSAFIYCKSLTSIKLSINLRFIGENAFSNCNLSSAFVPPRCIEIRYWAFAYNRNLEILNIPQRTKLVEPHWIIRFTVLCSKYPHRRADRGVGVWLKNINNDDKFALHRVCASFEPTLDLILDTMKEKGGPKAFKVKNSIGITPSRYLNENPYAKVTEKEVIEKYVLQMMGEVSNTAEV
ncbi:hypothetical protein CTEN210_13701 [Chaetoceros tenuissimus]|uniref:Uncharacterized protein n=1 Tax=Chaetoceros tenuissimus TaxID=426638 RepID=A0AAD3D5N5_9STRA|nr:hypothetical protein CTEN210_13701 [Chaetoceros tenuissimus]